LGSRILAIRAEIPTDRLGIAPARPAAACCKIAGARRVHMQENGSLHIEEDRP
jgi:hypothetical protein